MKLTEHQKREYKNALDQLDAVCTLAAAGFPRDDHIRIETRNPMPKGMFAHHYAFFKFLAETGRAALEDQDGK